MDKEDQTNPLVYLDIHFSASNQTRRLVIELFNNVVPLTAQNFLANCRNQELGTSYKNVPFHRIVKGTLAQGGDITKHNGTGTGSIYGPVFVDENFALRHDARGIVSMANSGRNTNTSQFMIMFKPCSFLDGHNVVFGKVTPDTLDVLDEIEEAGTVSDYYQMSQRVTIIGCGEITRQ